MPLLENPILANVVAGLIVLLIGSLVTWIWRRYRRLDIRLTAAVEQGPITRELGCTEPAIKITIANRSTKGITIHDVRLMFCGAFGAPVAAEAPSGRTHRELPAVLNPGTKEHWYIPAERLSNLLHSLYRPRRAIEVERNVKLRARCMTGTGGTYSSRIFKFSTDANSHCKGIL